MKLKLLKALALASMVASLSACGGDAYTEVTYAQFCEVDTDAESESPYRKPFMLEGQKIKTTRVSCVGFYDDYIVGQFYDEADSSGGRTVNDIIIKAPEGFVCSKNTGMLEGNLSMYDFFIPMGTMVNENGRPVIHADKIKVVERYDKNSSEETGAGGTYAYWNGYDRSTFSNRVSRVSAGSMIIETKFQLASLPAADATTNGGSFNVVFPGENYGEESTSLINVKVPSNLLPDTQTMFDAFFADRQVGDGVKLTLMGDYDWTRGGACATIIDPWWHLKPGAGRYNCAPQTVEFDNIFATYPEALTYLQDAKLNTEDFGSVTTFDTNVISYVVNKVGSVEDFITGGDVVDNQANAKCASVAVNSADAYETVDALLTAYAELPEADLGEGRTAKWVATQYSNAYTLEYTITNSDQSTSVRSAFYIFTDNISAEAVTLYMAAPSIPDNAEA